MIQPMSGPATVIHDAGLRALESAQHISDPIDRCRALEVAARNIPVVQQQLRQGRADAIREALATRSATDVAAELGISRTRLYKILED